jgi:hypothetical protein
MDIEILSEETEVTTTYTDVVVTALAPGTLPTAIQI